MGAGRASEIVVGCAVAAAAACEDLSADGRGGARDAGGDVAGLDAGGGGDDAGPDDDAGTNDDAHDAGLDVVVCPSAGGGGAEGPGGAPEPPADCGALDEAACAAAWNCRPSYAETCGCTCGGPRSCPACGEACAPFVACFDRFAWPACATGDLEPACAPDGRALFRLRLRAAGPACGDDLGNSTYGFLVEVDAASAAARAGGVMRFGPGEDPAGSASWCPVMDVPRCFPVLGGEVEFDAFHPVRGASGSFAFWLEVGWGETGSFAVEPCPPDGGVSCF